MEKAAFETRVEKVLAGMRAQGAGVLLVTPSSTMKYLTGYAVKPDERLLALVLAPGRRPFIVANALYELQLAKTPVEQFCYWRDGEDPFRALLSAIRERGIPTGSLAVDGAAPGWFVIGLMERLPGARVTLGNPLVDPLRVYKDDGEQSHMAEACRLAQRALEQVIGRGAWWLGRTESDFFAELSLQMSRLGLKAPSACVAVGANAAVPHHTTGNTVIEKGKCLLVDFTGVWENYYSDMTRTFHFGEPDDEFKRVYDIVLEANRRGREAAGTGGQLQEVDRAARGYIASQGYGPYFTHRTGHGIGIDMHEGPPAGEGETTLIRPGMAFSIEPGVYLPGKFGVRIEDQALVTGAGLRILHSFPRELTVIK